MLCDSCKQNEAVIHRITVINGKRSEQHLCSACAKNLSAVVFKLPTLSELVGQSIVPKSNAVCECGCTLSELLKTGLVGCEKCYSSIRHELLPVIKAAQGGKTEHTGKIPQLSDDRLHRLQALRNELAQAIDKEEYERAAELRDKIRAFDTEKAE